MNHIEKSKELGLSPEEYVLVGGSVLDIHHIRESDDIDVVVSKKAFKLLRERGWSVDEEFREKWGRERLVRDVFEVYTDLSFQGQNYLFPFEALKESSRKIDGVYVQTLGLLLLAKKDNNREKDRRDCVLIEQHLNINPVNLE